MVESIGADLRARGGIATIPKRPAFGVSGGVPRPAGRKKGVRGKLVDVTVVGGQSTGMRVVREARGRVAGAGVDLAYGFWPGRGMPIVAIHALTTSYTIALADPGASTVAGLLVDFAADCGV
jgi:hypothetical protein